MFKHLLPFAVIAVVVALLGGCSGGGLDTPSGNEISAVFYDGTQNRAAAPRLGTPDFSGPVGTWCFEILQDGVTTQGGSAPLGTVTVTDAGGTVIQRTNKAWNLATAGRYHVVGKNAAGRTLAEAWVTVTSTWYDIKGGVYISGDTGVYADVEWDGTLHGYTGDWSLAITAVGGGGIPGPVGQVEVRDENGNPINRTSGYRWPLLNEGLYHAWILDNEGAVIGYRPIWADPNYGRG